MGTGLESNVIELARRVGELSAQVEAAVEVLATKFDVHEVKVDVCEVKTRLDDHLSAQDRNRAFGDRLKIIIVTSLAGGVSAVVSGLFALFS